MADTTQHRTRPDPPYTKTEAGCWRIAYNGERIAVSAGLCPDRSDEKAEQNEIRHSMGDMGGTSDPRAFRGRCLRRRCG